MISRRANRIIAIQILFSGQIEENFDLTKD